MNETKTVRTKGIKCPGCAGVRLFALFTRHRDGATVRVRKCSACGHKIRTIERIESKSA